MNTSPFSAQVQSCLPVKGWAIPQEEIDRRMDLRTGETIVCSVDPPGCVDIDDALHARVCTLPRTLTPTTERTKPNPNCSPNPDPVVDIDDALHLRARAA